MSDASGQALSAAPPRRIMFCVGENSGDLHASRVLRELRHRQPDLRTFGYGGHRMEEAGFDLRFNLAQSLPIVGITQVIKNYGKLKQLMRDAEAMLASERPDLLVLVDYPGFNLRLSAAARRLGVPVLYYIAPQIWAWHASRIKIIQQNVSHVAVILPFEEALYRDAGVPVTYVGHPLLDDETPRLSREEARRELGASGNEPIVALLPGSRESEIRRHLPVLLSAARIIKAARGDVRFVIPKATTVPLELLQPHLVAASSDVSIRVLSDSRPEVRSGYDLALCKSGTSTLELALADVPHAVLYKTSALTAFMARRLVRIPYASLANIIAGREVTPEFLQERATPENLGQWAVDFLSNSDRSLAMKRDFAEIRQTLGGSGATARTVDVIESLLA